MRFAAQRRSGSRYRTLLRIALLVIILGGSLWGFWLEPQSLRVREHSLNPPAWPAPCAGLRIAVLADLHVGSPFNGEKNLARIIEMTNALAPDLVLLAGDFVIDGVLGGTFVPPERIAAALAHLRAGLGVYAVLGNHDWWLDPARVERALNAAGIGVLEDRSVAIERGACRFMLAGIREFVEGSPDVDRVLAALPTDATVIALTHNPDVFPSIPPGPVLTIAGHTHGGQVFIPGIGRPIVPSLYGERYAIGHIVEAGRHLFVSPGIGTSILPVRFLVRPEISLLVLNALP